MKSTLKAPSSTILEQVKAITPRVACDIVAALLSEVGYNDPGSLFRSLYASHQEAGERFIEALYKKDGNFKPIVVSLSKSLPAHLNRTDAKEAAAQILFVLAFKAITDRLVAGN